MMLTGAAAGYLMCAAWSAAAAVDVNAVSEGQVVAHHSFEPDEDLDYDDIPDDWVRRKGPKFPKYVKIGIDCSVGSDSEQSLRMDANGGAAVLYSPVNAPQARIDALHTYRFRGKIRTQGLKQDAALISVSLLNHRRQRIQRFLTPLVTGDQDWQTVQVPPITPDPEVRFVVIGCHLLPGEVPGIAGSAWFDDLVLTRSPGLSLDGEFFAHFLSEGSRVKVTAKVSGLDAGHDYSIRFMFYNAEGTLLEERTDPLPADNPETTGADLTSGKPLDVVMDLPPQEPGYYRMSAVLLRDGEFHLREETSLAVMRLVDKRRLRGEFGWSIGTPSKVIRQDVLVKIAAQAGINWIKYPVWNSVHRNDHERTGSIANLFEHMENNHISTIGIFCDPPDELRGKFARNWLGVSEIFSTQSSVWRPSVEPVVARFSSTIRHWQLGDESDTSFEGFSELNGTLLRAHQEINRIGLNAQIGIPWQVNRALPAVSSQTLGFVSLRESEPLEMDALVDAWKSHENSRTARWVVLQPKLLKGDSRERANQLVRRMIAAKMAKTDAIFVNQVLDGRDGLLNPDGSPTDLFLPWRTTALALQDGEYLGEIAFPDGSRNAVFVRDEEASRGEKMKEVIIFVWHNKPGELTEQFYLGENVVEMDLWGRASPVPTAATSGGKEQILRVTNTPKILRGCSEPVARWRLATQFAVGKMKSAYGTHADAILGANTFPSGISGKVLLETPTRDPARQQGDEGAAHAENNSGWQAEPREWTLTAAAKESFRLPVFLTLPTDANIGDSQMKLTFTITADRPYRFQVFCPYQVGLGDVSLQVIARKLPDERLEIEQIVTNATSPEEVLDFRCSLMVPGSRRQKLQISRLGKGVDRKFYYLPDAESFRGKDLRLKLEQEGGGRILNHKWTVGDDWEETADEFRPEPEGDRLQLSPSELPSLKPSARQSDRDAATR